MDRIPTPVYAAAGAGDLAYQKLRQLPDRVAELRGKVTELRPAVAELRGKVTELRPAVSEETLRADLDRLRAAARRNANTVVSGAQAAQQRAAVVYTDLVTRGEEVVRAARDQRAAKEAGAETITTTEAVAVEAEPATVAIPAAAEVAPVETTVESTVEAAVVATPPVAPAPVAPAPKPAKRTRPAAKS
jgi:hypothetical protein